LRTKQEKQPNIGAVKTVTILSSYFFYVLRLLVVGNFLKGFSPGQGKSTLSPQTVKQIRCLSAFYNVGESGPPLSRQIQYVEDKKKKKLRTIQARPQVPHCK
jgi:hypothetical protein